MQKLHLVGFTADKQGLIFSSRRGSKSGGFVLPVTESFLAAIDALRAGDDITPVAADEPKRPRTESALSVREVQARLRVGRSIAEVAREAGVDQDWVERFAIPVIAEQRRVIDEAHLVHLDKRGWGQSALPLGESVRRNIGGKGVAVTEDEYQSAWSAHQVHDSHWVLRFRYTSRGHEQVVAWDYDQTTGTLSSQDRLGTTLGFVEPGAELGPAPRARRSTARRRAAAVRTTRSAVTPAKRGSKKKATAKKAATKKRATAKKAASRKGATRKAVSKKAATRKAATTRKPAVRKSPIKRAAGRSKAAPKKMAARKKAAPKKTAARKAAGRKRTPPAAPRVAVMATAAEGNGSSNGHGERARRQLRAR